MPRSIAFSLLFLIACDPAAAPEAKPGAEQTDASAPATRVIEDSVPSAAAPSDPEPGDAVADPGAAAETGSAPAVPSGSDSGHEPEPSRRSGEGCRDGSACGAGETCVGDGLEGCGGDPGRCERDVQCTRDLQPFCGCDGATFRASSRCPGREFAYRGECGAKGGAEGSKPGPAGAACLSGEECASGICEGRGCGPKQAGRCMPADRVCTTDAVVYCGCDDRKFNASSRCPGRRYRNLGDCHG